jgi:PKD repeat protein
VTPNVVALGASVNASVPFTDPDQLDTHTATWNWGDGTTTAGTVTESGGAGTVTGSHLYAGPGVYTVTVTVNDGYGNSDSAVYEFVVVYDPNGGFATGGGWITTAAGGLTTDPAAEGKSAIGFVARYLPGATVPTGSVAFTFHAGGFQFKSRSFDWLVVSGSSAQLRGAGTVNGAGTYQFLLIAQDGKPDRLSLKIWTTDPASPTYVANNRTIKGSIIVHKAK